MRIKVKKNMVFLLLSLVLVISCIILVNRRDDSDKKTNFLHTSWYKGYGSFEELVKDSDLIALVQIGEHQEAYENSGIPFSNYDIMIIEAIYGGAADESLLIHMTGGYKDKEKYEVFDDPLPAADDEYLIFARKNTSGTYTILGGPQGRFAYKEGKITSLKFSNDRLRTSNMNEGISILNKDATEIIEEIRELVTTNK